MLIANPMYDAVFKHPLEDPESARLIVGTILGEDIEEIELAPQESAVVVRPRDDGPRLSDFTVQRIDFAATVRTAAGDRLRVLIEVQKSHYSADVARFRKYLGQRYADEQGYVTVSERGGDRSRALPLLTIYFLGRRLPKTDATVLRVARRYLDAVTGEELPQREDFVEALTHDCYVVQVPFLAGNKREWERKRPVASGPCAVGVAGPEACPARSEAKFRVAYGALSDERRNDLEKLLSVFDQRLQTADQHMLELDHAAIPTAYAPVLRRLEAAAADAAVAESMALEDEILGEWNRMQRDIDEAKETIADRDETIADHEKTIAERDEAIAGHEKTIAERDEAIAEAQEALLSQRARIDALERRLAGSDDA